ncbi:hypothetical protein QYB64_003221 [Clostridium perfringens]|nr:hypothetical protein [Clostridium perfringens]
MMARIDKYFILELQEQGYDLDYKRLTEIYRKSRERDDYKRNKAHNDRVNDYVNKKMIEIFEK